MRVMGLGLLLLAGCVHHVRPQDTALPAGLAWCPNAKRTLVVAPSSSAPTSGVFVEAMLPCMKILQAAELDVAALILKMNTSSSGVLTGMCLEAINFDEPELLECVARRVWQSPAKLVPNLSAEPYLISLYLD